MDRLRVEVNGAITVLEGMDVVRIGRSPDADILLLGETVSRKHAELRPTSRGWVLVDVGSHHGTYVDGRRVHEHRVTEAARIYCGLSGTGGALTLTPDRQDAATGAPRASDAPVAPVAPVAPGAVAGPLTGPDVLVEAEGVSHRFRHPTVVLIGRGPASAVLLDNPAVAPEHGRLDAAPGGWTYTNLARDGTFIGGRRTERLPLEDRVALRLGHPAGGAEVVLTPLYSAATIERRMTRRRRRRWTIVALGFVATMVVLAAITTAVVVLLLDRGTSPTLAPPAPSVDRLTGDELDTAKLATVLLYAEGEDAAGRQVAWSGSGSIISPTGLILTNAHVAAPEAPGLDLGPEQEALRNPPYLQVALVTSADDGPADPAYRARVVESDGSHDAALLQIYATTNGRPVAEELALPTVPLGDSDSLRTGDDVTVLGFPGISGSRGVSVTRGVISTFVADPATGEDRAEIDTDARIAPGNSGGLAIDNAGELIGIPSALYTEKGSVVASGRLRPLALIMPMIERASAR